MKTSLVPDLDNEIYYFHSRLLSEAGYISVYKVGTMGGDFYWPRQLKWDGVGAQFLKMFTDESFWQCEKKEATSKGVNMALDAFM